MANTHLWTTQLTDRRSRKVIFLSHCLLNENTRYLGGAGYAGSVPAIIQTCLEGGIGIVQMPCPEQHAWGGVLKRRLLWFFGSQGTWLYQLRNLLLPILLWYTRRIYRTLARQVANQIRDYVSSGFTVVGVVGVDGSPSCGVLQTLDMPCSLELIGRLSPTAHADDMNAIVQTCLVDGKGIFIEGLQQELERHRLNVTVFSHDLIAELQGRTQPFRI